MACYFRAKVKTTLCLPPWFKLLISINLTANDLSNGSMIVKTLFLILQGNKDLIQKVYFLFPAKFMCTRKKNTCEGMREYCFSDETKAEFSRSLSRKS